MASLQSGCACVFARWTAGRTLYHTGDTCWAWTLIGWSYDRELEKSPPERSPPSRNPEDTRSRFGYLSHLTGTLQYQLERKIHSMVDD